ncbi:MAG: phage virion morphogenesis protein [Flavobacteriales bacterium]|nr:phage virion morphogenesis protein [Flavobacteriales bacterium]
MTVRITGDRQTIKRLRGIDLHLRNLKPTMQKIAKELVSYVEGEVFESQGGVLGRVWPAVKPDTMRRKSRLRVVSGTQTLVASGKMRSNFKSDVGNKSLRIFNPTAYFKYHNSTEPRSKMPYRPMLLVNDVMERKVYAIVKRDIELKISRGM